MSQKKHAEKEVLQQKMQGFVSHEKEKFERLAHAMKKKDEKLRQVKELIRNSPCGTRTPLKDNTQQRNTHTSPSQETAGKVRLEPSLHKLILHALTNMASFRGQFENLE